jgi:hypothetical protein
MAKPTNGSSIEKIYLARYLTAGRECPFSDFAVVYAATDEEALELAGEAAVEPFAGSELQGIREISKSQAETLLQLEVVTQELTHLDLD